jgi:hypothetical protein
VFERVAVNRNDIRQLAFFESSDPILSSEHFGADANAPLHRQTRVRCHVDPSSVYRGSC